MKTTIDKAELKKQIIYNVKTLYRKTIDGNSAAGFSGSILCIEG